MPHHLLIPLDIPREHGFFAAEYPSPGKLLGHETRVLIDEPYYYLVIEDIDPAHASTLLERTLVFLNWASIQVGFSIRPKSHQLAAGVQSGLFDGSNPAVFSGAPITRPIRASASVSSHEGDIVLTRALIEASAMPAFKNQEAEFKLCCELFASVDFEATQNAQFITLTSILEIMARPSARPSECITLIDEMMDKARDQMVAATGDVKQALESLTKNANFWKKESFRGSILILGKRVSAAMGYADPEKRGKLARSLYDKRSLIVHGGETASRDELMDLRQFVREVLSVEAGSTTAVRDPRYEGARR